MSHKLTVLVSALIVVLTVSTAYAGGAYPPGSTGYDISFRQCGSAYPPTPFAFGIVGVTSGRAFDHNACLSDEFTWARQSSPSLYMNLNAPIGTTSKYGLSGPKGNCTQKDKACIAYNYGWNAAKDAFDYAGSSGATSSDWWLDIETSNSWSANTSLNEQTIQGAVDFLTGQTIAVGVYSTGSMWKTIAGSYQPKLPNWVPGAKSVTDAQGYCSTGYSFGGGSVILVQYPNGSYDGDYACP